MVARSALTAVELHLLACAALLCTALHCSVWSYAWPHALARAHTTQSHDTARTRERNQYSTASTHAQHVFGSDCCCLARNELSLSRTLHACRPPYHNSAAPRQMTNWPCCHHGRDCCCGGIVALTRCLNDQNPPFSLLPIPTPPNATTTTVTSLGATARRGSARHGTDTVDAVHRISATSTPNSMQPRRLLVPGGGTKADTSARVLEQGRERGADTGASSSVGSGHSTAGPSSNGEPISSGVGVADAVNINMANGSQCCFFKNFTECDRNPGMRCETVSCALLWSTLTESTRERMWWRVALTSHGKRSVDLSLSSYY
jgi:hypothetical protein